MDLFTHFVLPYLLAWGLRRPRRERLAAGIGGWAPDMDAFTSPAILLDERVYFLGHRGLSHGLLGAPLYALAVAGVLTLPWWSRRWPRLAALRFTPTMVAVAVLASFTHLALDMLTMWGVPLLFPLTDARFGLDWFFYSVVWAIPFSGAFLVLLWRRAPERRLLQVGAVLCAVLLASGALRLAWRPDAPDAARVVPGNVEWRWATIHRLPDRWEVQSWSFGRPGVAQTYLDLPPGSPEAEAAHRVALAHPAAKAYFLYGGGPHAVTVEPRLDGGWNVTFTDLMRRSQFMEGGARKWIPGADDFGVLRMRVDEGVARELDA